MPDDPVASLEKVCKSFRGRMALDDFSMTIAKGEIVALLGPNGAGKTTALSLLLGLRRPDSGKVTLFGLSPSNPKARLQIGVTPQETAFPPHLKVREVLALGLAHYADPIPASQLLAELDLSNLAERQTGGLSGGEKRRLALALAFVGRPRATTSRPPLRVLCKPKIGTKSSFD